MQVLQQMGNISMMNYYTIYDVTQIVILQIETVYQKQVDVVWDGF